MTKSTQDTWHQSRCPLAGISVVIVNYFTSKMVSDCINSLDSKLVKSVVIVDNSSDQDELNSLRRLTRVPLDIQVVDAGGNIGFGAGVNLGLREVVRDPSVAIWVLNPDIVVDSGCESLLLSYLNSSDCGIVSPLITYGQSAEKKIWYCGGSVEEATGRAVHWRHNELFANVDRFPIDVSFMCGAAPMFAPNSLSLLEGFREDLFLYWEDVELSLRANDAGIQMAVLPAATVWHHVGGSSHEVGLSKAFYYYSQRNRVLILRERIGWHGVFFGRGLLETLKRLLSPLRWESDERFAKFHIGIRGLLNGCKPSFGEGRQSRIYH